MKRNLYFIPLVLFILSACTGEGSQVQTATAMQGETKTPKPTPTKEPTSTPIPEIRIETDPTVETDKLPVVTYEDFVTGKVMEAERKYLETYNPFNGNEIWPDNFKVTPISIDKGIGNIIKFGDTTPPLKETYFKNPYLFPARNLFYFRITLPKDFFPFPITPAAKAENYNFDYNYGIPFILVGQVWPNPDSQSENPNDKYRVLHYLYFYYNNTFYVPGDLSKTFLPLPFYSMKIEKFENNNDYFKDIFFMIQKTLYQKYYKGDIPTKYFDQWLKTNRIPKELENFILPSMRFILT